MGLRLAALLRILLKPDFEVHCWGLFWDPKVGPKIDQKTQKQSAKNSEKNQTRRDPGIQKKRFAEASQSYLEPIANLTPLLITYKDLLQPALVACM